MAGETPRETFRDIRAAADGITSMADLLARNLGVLSEAEVRQILRLINRSGDLVRRLAVDLDDAAGLPAASPDDGGTRLRKALAHALQQRGEVLPRALRLAVPEHLRVAADRAVLEQALVSLLRCARRTGGGPVAVTAWQEAGQVVVLVHDPGPQASPDVYAQMAADALPDQPLDPADLGTDLQVVRRLVGALGGTTDHTMTARGGVDVLVHLPAVEAARRPATAPHDHAVTFYADDDDLVGDIATFAQEGLAEGEAVLVVATAPHRSALEVDLAMRGAAHHDEVTYLDAVETLGVLAPDGTPDPEVFWSVLAPMIEQALREHGAVRIYGEMVALLWAADRQREALALEELWNELRVRLPFSLLCGYPTPHPDGDLAAQGFAGVCAAHGTVIQPGLPLVE